MPYLTEDELRESISIWRGRFPQETSRSIEEADSHAAGFFSPAHSMAAGRKIQLGESPDWKLNPTRDPEFTWLVNRFSHALDFGRAWALTGNDVYVRAFVGHVRSWLAQNPVDFDTPYETAVFFQRPGPWRLLETGLRTENWLLARQLMEGSAAMDDRFRSELDAAIADHADYLCRFLGSPDINHAMMHMLGPLSAGIGLPGHPRAPWWRQVAAERFDLCLHRQVNEEGVHSELTPLYHNLSLRLFARYHIAARKAGLPVPAGFADRLRSMAAFTEATVRPDGLTAAFADGDPNDSGTTTLAFLGAALDDEDLCRKGKASSEILWTIGPEAWKRYERFFGAAPPEPVSAAFPKTGFFSLRGERTQVLFDAAALGGPHGHADALSFELSGGGIPLIVDPGRYTYEEGEWRRYFKGTKAHSTITIDGEDQTPYRSSQEWGEPEAACRVLRRKTGARFDYIAARHTGYHRLGDPVSVERRLVFRKETDTIVVVDILEAEGTHEADLRFPLNRPAATRLAPDGNVYKATAEFRRPDGQAVVLEAVLKRKGAFADSAAPRFDSGWLSDRYARKEEIPVLSWTGRFSGRVMFISVFRVRTESLSDQGHTPGSRLCRTIR